MSTNDATDNIFSSANPEVINHDSITPGATIAGGDTPRLFPRQTLSGSQRGILNITGEIIVTDPTDNTQFIAIDGTSGTVNIADGGSITIGNNIQISSNSATSDEAIIVTNADGSKVGMGSIPDGSGDFGFFAQDLNGNLLYKIVGSTQYIYDITQNPHTNVMQAMKLPDGSYGWAVAATGFNVSDGYS